MRKNISPWVSQLRADRPQLALQKDTEADVAIVGAGIAGVSTAFFLLKYTAKSVVMVDRFKLAHGATGHNAGQVVSYFERSFSSIVDEFGNDLAAAAERDVEGAWQLIDEMYTEAGLRIPFSRFLGYAGFSDKEQVFAELRDNAARKKSGLHVHHLYVADDAAFLHEIPHEYKGLYTITKRSEVLTMLETSNASFVAAVAEQKGCVNSALFCEEVVLYLLRTYSGRFTLYEHTPVNKVVLKNDHAILDGGKATIICDRVVLCTNGFEDLSIFNEHGLDINTKFHHMVEGKIGYMSGYVENMNKPPTAVSYLIDSDPVSGEPYFTDTDPNTGDPYFYLTRRMYDISEGAQDMTKDEQKNQTPQKTQKSQKTVNLISIGGPEKSVDDRATYSRDEDYPDEAAEQIDAFVRSTYDTEPNKKFEYVFTWHGLMGYTRNRIRLIGPEPKNPVLLYNLGCNGVGILPSVYGGSRIAKIIRGDLLAPSIFDITSQDV